MDEEVTGGFIWSIFQHASELSNITKSAQEINSILDTVLSKINSRYDLIASMIRLGSDQFGSSLNHARGLPREQCEYILNKFEKINVSSYDVHQNMDLSGVSQVNAAQLKLDLSNVTHISKIQLQSNLHIEFIMYNDDKISIGQDLHPLEVILNIIANQFFARLHLEETRKHGIYEITGFNGNPLPMLIIDRSLNIVKINDEGSKLLGKPALHTVFNLENFIISENTIREDIQKEHPKDILNYERQVIRLPIHSVYQIDKLRTDIHVSSKIIERKYYFIISIIVVEQGRSKQLHQVLLDSQNSLTAQIVNYSNLFKEGRQEAIDYGLDNFFPGAFSFTINEHSGPMVLCSSPEIDHDIVFEETIKLLAGLNSEQIVDQGYLTGVNPWSNPPGELRWIAFSKPNLGARGHIEIHLIGLVTKSSLLMLKPEIANTLLGLLLGTMNRLIEVMSEDNADFVTKPFAHDRNFSTISLLAQALLELRTDSAEILAVYS